MELNNEYYLTQLDACLADSSSVVTKLFSPISVPGIRPESVHGERLVDGQTTTGMATGEEAAEGEEGEEEGERERQGQGHPRHTF